MIPERTDTRLHWSLAVGRVTLTYDGRPVQQAQVQFTGDRLVDPVSLMQHFGLATRPPVGSKVVGLFLQGDPVNGVAVASNHVASRPTDLKEGDAKLYDVRGVYLWLSANGPVLDAGGLPVTVQNAKSVEVTATDHVTVTAPSITLSATKTIKLDAPTVEVTGTLQVDPAATGVFVSQDGYTITVAKGVTTKIV